MWLNHVLDRNFLRAPHAVALRDARREVTWSQMRADVHAMAASLAALARPGDRVALMSGNRVEVLEAYFACARARVVVVPVNPALAPPEIEYILSRTGPSLAVADDAGQDKLAVTGVRMPVLAIERLAGEAGDPGGPSSLVSTAPPGELPSAGHDLGEPFAILHTSATTGRPKGVVVDQRSLQAGALSHIADAGLAPGTIFLSASPLFHGSLVIPLTYLAARATVCVLDSFTPQACLTALEAWHVEHAFMVPAMVRLLVGARGLASTDISRLRLIVHAAAPMPPDLAVQAEQALKVDLQTIFGITEGGGPVLSLAPDDQPGPAPVDGATCAGIAMPGTAVQVRRADGDLAATGEIGEIHLAGDTLMRGYWEDPQATAQVLADGWLNTHDLGCVDADGFVWVVNRRQDLILRGGQNVYPAEIEHVLRRSPLIADVAVVAAPSAEWGQVPVAFVELTAGRDLDMTSLAELVDLCGSQLAGYKRPSRFVAVPRIPRNPAGKVLRAVLAGQALDQPEERNA